MGGSRLVGSGADELLEVIAQDQPGRGDFVGWNDAFANPVLAAVLGNSQPLGGLRHRQETAVLLERGLEVLVVLTPVHNNTMLSMSQDAIRIH